MEPYRFEHEGLTIEFSRSTIRSYLEAERIQWKLLGALGYTGGRSTDDADSSDDGEDITFYAEAMSRVGKIDAPWWSHANMTEAQIGAAYKRFMDDESPTLLLNMRKAFNATALPKKTTEPTQET